MNYDVTVHNLTALCDVHSPANGISWEWTQFLHRFFCMLKERNGNFHQKSPARFYLIHHLQKLCWIGKDCSTIAVSLTSVYRSKHLIEKWRRDERGERICPSNCLKLFERSLPVQHIDIGIYILSPNILINWIERKEKIKYKCQITVHSRISTTRNKECSSMNYGPSKQHLMGNTQDNFEIFSFSSIFSSFSRFVILFRYLIWSM